MMTEIRLQCTTKWKSKVKLMKKQLVSLVLLMLSIGLLTACSTELQASEAYKGEDPGHIFTRGKEELKGNNYAEAIKRFEALDVQYPFGRQTEEAQLYLIYAYYMKEQYTLASAAADRFIHNHPANKHADYAYYMRGLSDYYQNMGVLERIFSVDLATRDLTQMQRAYNDFSELVRHFHHSPYTPAAYQYTIYLRNVMANHQYHVAKFYYDRRAYVASANRAADVIAHYQGAPAVKDSLKVLAKSYKHLHSNELAADTIRVINANFPNLKV